MTPLMWTGAGGFAGQLIRSVCRLGMSPPPCLNPGPVHWGPAGALRRWGPGKVACFQGPESASAGCGVLKASTGLSSFPLEGKSDFSPCGWNTKQTHNSHKYLIKLALLIYYKTFDLDVFRGEPLSVFISSR